MYVCMYVCICIRTYILMAMSREGLWRPVEAPPPLPKPRFLVRDDAFLKQRFRCAQAGKGACVFFRTQSRLLSTFLELRLPGKAPLKPKRVPPCLFLGNSWA